MEPKGFAGKAPEFPLTRVSRAIWWGENSPPPSAQLLPLTYLFDLPVERVEARCAGAVNQQEWWCKLEVGGSTSRQETRRDGDGQCGEEEEDRE